jgi:hypothetical protein
MQTGAAGSRRSEHGRGPRPDPVVAFDPEGEIVVRDNRAATRAAVADDFAARFGLEDVESTADTLADRYGFRYEEAVEGVPSRRTVTITGHGAERIVAPGREVRRAPRRRNAPRRRSETVGFAADRFAMWAVLLCSVLAFVAATSGHALH